MTLGSLDLRRGGQGPWSGLALCFSAARASSPPDLLPLFRQEVQVNPWNPKALPKDRWGSRLSHGHLFFYFTLGNWGVRVGGGAWELPQKRASSRKAPTLTSSSQPKKRCLLLGFLGAQLPKSKMRDSGGAEVCALTEPRSGRGPERSRRAGLAGGDPKKGLSRGPQPRQPARGLPSRIRHAPLLVRAPWTVLRSSCPAVPSKGHRLCLWG